MELEQLKKQLMEMEDALQQEKIKNKKLEMQIEQLKEPQENEEAKQPAGILLMEGEDVDVELENFSDDSLDLEDIPPLDSYSMNHKIPGEFLIFNHETFEKTTSVERYGADEDKVALKKAAKTLGFECQTFKDYKTKRVKHTLKDVSTQRFKNDDCLVCCYLTHGTPSGLLSTKDGEIRIEELWNSFSSDNCPGLAGKPKIFIIQSCRGTKKEEFVGGSKDQLDQVGSEDEIGVEGFDLPADVILAYSTIPGFGSWRNNERGSYFIQALCTVINEQPYLDINEMLIRANSEMIATLRQKNDKMLAQVACFQSTLTKKLHFQPVPNPT